jgi:hypothetical protein
MLLAKKGVCILSPSIAIVFGAVRVDIMDTINTLPERKGKRATGVHILILRNYRGEKNVFLIIHKKIRDKKKLLLFYHAHC